MFVSYVLNHASRVKPTRLDWSQNRRNTRKLAIKITRVRRILNLGQERRRNALMIDIIPVNIPEKRLVHDLLRIRGATSKTLIRLTSEQFL